MSNSSELALGSIGLKEAPYIEEWVLYHLFIGVDMIYVYDNEEEPTYHAMFECNPRVHVMHYPWSARSHPDRGVQISATMDFVELVRGRHKWVMFPDMDDFLVALDYPDIKQYLRLHMRNGVDAIAFQWWVYTQSQQAYKADRPSMDRFNYRERRPDRRIKTLYDVNAVVTQVCPVLLPLTAEQQTAEQQTTDNRQLQAIQVAVVVCLYLCLFKQALTL